MQDRSTTTRTAHIRNLVPGSPDPAEVKSSKFVICRSYRVDHWFREQGTGSIITSADPGRNRSSSSIGNKVCAARGSSVSRLVAWYQSSLLTSPICVRKFSTLVHYLTAPTIEASKPKRGVGAIQSTAISIVDNHHGPSIWEGKVGVTFWKENLAECDLIWTWILNSNNIN